MKINPLPSQDYLNLCLEYLPDGNLLWKARPQEHFNTSRGHAQFSARCIGKPATNLVENYQRIWLTYKSTRQKFLAHRVIWVMHNGAIPENFIVDHKDTNSLNNKISNLRLTQFHGNAYNKSLNCNNSSGVKGVSWSKEKELWDAKLRFNSKRIRVGYFKSITDAESAIQTARKQLHKDFANHG
jgi:hypothetical protein